MEQIIEYIKQTYSPLSIILYGSYANGTNNLNSDFDALVISHHHEEFHDTSFVCPKKTLKWMEENHPLSFTCYGKALNDFSMESLSSWISCLEEEAHESL